MKTHTKNIPSLVFALATLLLVCAFAFSREKPISPQFKYVGGTEDLVEGCEGNLELTSAVLTFKCPPGSVSVPYSSITLLEYRSNVSRRIRKLKLHWKVSPPYGGGSKNRFFTVLFAEGGASRAIVLKVPPQSMRPYLAEIDLKAGKRVEVENHEEY